MGLKTAGVGHFQIPTAPAVGTAVAQSASANTFGSYVQMTASTSAALYITGICITATLSAQSPNYVAVNIGTGGAGSETTVDTQVAGLPNVGTVTTSIFIPIEPPVPVANATRIACKTASDIASAISWKITLVCINQSNVVDDGTAMSANVVQINGGATNGNNATLSLAQLNIVNSAGDAMICSSTGSNGNGINASGNGTGAGVLATGGATGIGLFGQGGATSGAGAQLQGTGGGHGLRLSGTGANAGLSASGGATGHGISASGGGTSGNGINVQSGGASSDAVKFLANGTSGNGLVLTGVGGQSGLSCNGQGAGAAAIFTGGGTGPGAKFVGGATSGDGIDIVTTSGDGLSILPTAGNAIVATANGTSKHGFVITGGTAGTSDGLKCVAGTGGVDIRGNITGNVTGNLSGSVNSVTTGVTVTTNNDKTGYTLTVTPPTAATIATTVWQDLTSGGDFGTVGSIGALLKADINAPIGSIPTNPFTGTLAQIATQVWQDATASDFTTAGSIGLSLGGSLGTALFTAGKIKEVTLVDTLTTYTGDTPQTGDCFARLGAPAGASVSADIAAVKAQTNGIAAIPTNPLLATGAPANFASLVISALGVADANIRFVNAVQVKGAGVVGNTWGP